jgi:C1A family cysteine protease
MVAVGYGNNNVDNYFLVRSAWGADWGDQGYVKIAGYESYGASGVCGIYAGPVFPTLSN